MKIDSALEEYFSGRKIYGNDLSGEELEAWYKDEQEGYAYLGAKDNNDYRYVYHALNTMHGYAYLGKRTFTHALGIGSAYGDEFRPIAGQIGHISIVDPSQYFQVSEVDGVSVAYYEANPSGDLPLPDNSVDLITCLGVLHHIANVSDVVRELFRCLQVHGVVLMREPIVSMGDWRKPRKGLTRRERGLPLEIFTKVIEEAGFEITRLTVFGYSPIIKLARLVTDAPYNYNYFTWLDKQISKLFLWNYRYHRNSLLAKFSPTACFWVLQKP
jgi:SAM-dependent methyltransferase